MNTSIKFRTDVIVSKGNSFGSTSGESYRKGETFNIDEERASILEAAKLKLQELINVGNKRPIKDLKDLAIRFTYSAGSYKNQVKIISAKTFKVLRVIYFDAVMPHEL